MDIILISEILIERRMKGNLSVFIVIAIAIAVFLSCSNAGIDESLGVDGATARLLIPDKC